MKNTSYDMTVGNPTGLLLKFALPMVIGNLVQQLYSMVDAMIVGHYIGADALGAVGATGSINFLFFSLSFGLSAGIGILVSQYFGARDITSLQQAIGNSIYVLLFSSFIMSVPGIVLARPILVLLSTPESILNDAVIYMQITCLGILAIAGYNGIAAILRALGDAKTPLIFLVISSVINIGLDFLFILSFSMGVFGAALATLISQLVAAVGCIVYAVLKIELMQIPKEYLRPDKDIILKSFRIGTPIALQSSLIAISCIFLQGVINTFGETVVAANTAVTRFEQLVQQPFNSLGSALATYTGQNMGAGKIKRIKKGLVSGTLICLGFSLIVIPLAQFGGDLIMKLFVDDKEVIEFGVTALKITSVFYFFLGMIYVFRSILNGAGDTTYAMVNGAVEISGRVGLAKPLTMIPQLGVWGIWVTTGLTWFITALVSGIRYAGGKWKRKSLVVSDGINIQGSSLGAFLETDATKDLCEENSDL